MYFEEASPKMEKSAVADKVSGKVISSTGVQDVVVIACYLIDTKEQSCKRITQIQESFCQEF